MFNHNNIIRIPVCDGWVQYWSSVPLLIIIVNLWNHETQSLIVKIIYTIIKLMHNLTTHMYWYIQIILYVQPQKHCNIGDTESIKKKTIKRQLSTFILVWHTQWLLTHYHCYSIVHLLCWQHAQHVEQAHRPWQHPPSSWSIWVWGLFSLTVTRVLSAAGLASREDRSLAAKW